MEIKAEGTKILNPGTIDEATISWVLLDALGVKDMDDNDILDDLGMFAYNGGAGRPFSHTPLVYRKNTRVVVTQFHGLDV